MRTPSALAGLVGAARSDPSDTLTPSALADYLHDAERPPTVPGRVPRWLRLAWVGHEPPSRFRFWGARTGSSPPRPSTVLRDLASRFGLTRLGSCRLAGLPCLACDGGDLRPLAALLGAVHAHDRAGREYLLPPAGADLRETPPAPTLVFVRCRPAPAATGVPT